MLPQALPRQLSQLQAPAICFLRAFNAAVCPPPNASAGLAKATLAATSPSHLFLRAFKAAVCPPPNASAGLAKATLAATGPSHLFLAVCPPPNAFRRPCQGNTRSYRPQPSVFKGVQGCRLPAPKCFRKLSQLQAPAICFLRAFKAAVCPPPNASAGLAKATLAAPSVLKGVQGCRLPAPKCFRKALPRQFSQLQPQPSVLEGVQGCAVCPPPNASASLAKATLAATGPSHLFLRAFKAAVCPPPNASAGNSHSYRPKPSGVHARPQMLPQALPRQLSQLQAPAICF